MASQTSARGASRYRGRGRAQADSEPRSDTERKDQSTDRRQASEKKNFTVRGAAATRGNPSAKGRDNGSRNQDGLKAKGTESRRLSNPSRENARGKSGDNSRGERGAMRSQAGSSNNREDRKLKGDGIQGHFVEYLRGGGAARGRDNARGNARGGVISRGGSKSHGSRAPPPSTPSSSSLAKANLGAQTWRDPRQEENGNYMQRMSDLYQTIKKSREQERKVAIRNGTLADPDKPTSLANAITPVGTCQDMCPEFERVERIVQNMVDGCEKGQTVSGSSKVPYEEYMVKRFRRSAAGYDEQLPSDIRPPQVLQRTLNYLIDEVVGNADNLGSVHKFVWDRTRGIRNDFSIQQVTEREDILLAVDCFERIARFHILSLHLLSRPGSEDFDHHQEREQLNNTLLSLMYYYDDNKKRMTFPNEAEFRSYCIVSEIQDQRPDLEDRMQNWGAPLLRDRRIENALKIYAAAGNAVDEQGPLRPRVSFSLAQGNYGRFWASVSSNATSYLLACTCEAYFNLVRANALETIVKAYRRGSAKSPAGAKRSEDLILSDIAEFLGLDTEDQVQTFCEEHGFTIGEKENGEGFLDVSSVQLGGLSDSNPRRKQIYSENIVEAKRHGRTVPALINGFSVAKAREHGCIDEEHSREVSMNDAEEDRSDDADDTSSEKTFSQPQSASPTKATFTKPPTPTTSTPRNPFDTATRPPQPNPIGSENPLASPKRLNSASASSANPYPLSSAISSQNDSFGQTASTTTPFELISSVDPSRTSNLLPFSAAMQQFNTPGPSINFQELKQPNTATEKDATRQPASLFNQTSTSSLFNIPKSALPPLNPAFNFGDGFKAAPSTTIATTPSSSQASVTLSQPLTPAATPGSTVSLNTGTAKTPLFNFATPTSTPPRAKTPPATTFQVGPSQGQDLPAFSLPASKSPLFQPTPQAAIEKERSAPEPTGATTPTPSEPALTAIPSSLIAAVDSQKAAKDELLDQLARELMTGGDVSYMAQFLEHTLGGIVKESMEIVQKESDDKDVEQMRTWFLSRKYGQMWSRIARDRFLFREREARMKRMAEARKVAAEEREAAHKARQGETMHESPKRQPRMKSTTISEHALQIAPSPLQGNRQSFNPQLTAHSSNPYILTGSTSSQTGSSGKKRKQGHEEMDSHENGHKRVRTLSVSTPSSINSGQALGKQTMAGSWKNHAKMEKEFLEAHRYGPVVKWDTTRSTYFKMIAMGLDPDTPIVPLTKKDIAEAERKAAVEAEAVPDHNLDGSVEHTGNPPTQNLSNNQNNTSQVLKPITENATAVSSPHPTIEHKMGPPQTPMKALTSFRGSPKASYSPEERALFGQVAEIKAQLDTGSEWYRDEVEKIRRSTSSRSSPAIHHPITSLPRSRRHHRSPSQQSTAGAPPSIMQYSPGVATYSPGPATHATTNGVKQDAPTPGPKSPSYWRSRISKIYRPDEKAREVKRQKSGVLPKETDAQKRLREFNAGAPSRTQVRLANSGGENAWLEKSVYGQQQKAAKGNGKARVRGGDWRDMDYFDEDDGGGGSEDEYLTDAEEDDEWDGQEEEDDEAMGFAAVGQNGFAGSPHADGIGGGATGASADDAIEL